jgi:hypothetical protein
LIATPTTAKTKKTMTYETKRNDMIDNPVASFWLKDAIRALDSRDPVDALNDVEELHRIFTQRLRDVSAEHLRFQRLLKSNRN